MGRARDALVTALAAVQERLARRVRGIELELDSGTRPESPALTAAIPRLVARLGNPAHVPTASEWLVSVAESASAELAWRMRAGELEARSAQLLREMAVLRTEHQAIVEQNVREQDRILALEREDASRLEALVRERTQALEVMNQRLVEINALKDRFLWHVSHEVRTPLHGLMGHLELARGTQLTREQHALLDTAWCSAEVLRTVIGDVVDFSRLETGLVVLEPCDFALRSSLGSILKIVGPRDLEHGPELVCDVDPAVPDAVRGDLGRLRQVLLNLVGNAFKFTESGTVDVRVALDGEAGPETPVSAPLAATCTIRVTVADTGIGIVPEMQARVFDPFWQVDASAARSFEGTGLGLALVKRLVETMGGRVWLESELGYGSRFHFTVPLELAARARPPALEVPSWRDARALVVERSERQRGVLSELLSRLGFQPVAVRDVELALEALESARLGGASFAATLVDSRLRSESGAAGAGALEDAGPGLGTVVELRPASSAAAAGTGPSALRVLVKPVLEPELAATLRAVVEPFGSVGSQSESTVADADRPASASTRVLVVEDNPVSRKLAGKMLTKRGFEVAFATNGREALEVLAAERFDVVLMDVQMPEMDGLAATEAIREGERGTGAHVPIVAMTASSTSVDRDRCLAAGMDLYLPKPVGADALFAAIATATGRT